MSPDAPSRPPANRGRPPSTTRDEVARAALELFIRNGFEETTLTDIAEALGIGRRTLFRYFASKNDMVWGDFDWVLDRLRTALAASDPDEGPMTTLGRSVVASNQYDGDALVELRLRMTLITTVPALQAHSMLRYDAWRRVISEFIATRTGAAPDDFVPLIVGHLALATSMAAFVRWVDHPDEALEDHLRAGYERLARAFPDLTGS
jgi:TetR/AcrR family transcriptional regulator, regulator of mycofactocin system